MKDPLVSAVVAFFLCFGITYAVVTAILVWVS